MVLKYEFTCSWTRFYVYSAPALKNNLGEGVHDVWQSYLNVCTNR